MGFYLQYLATWPEYFMVEEAPHGTGRLSCYSAWSFFLGGRGVGSLVLALMFVT